MAQPFLVERHRDVDRQESMRSGNVIKTRNDIYTTSLSAESDLLNDMLTLTGNFSYSYTRNSFHGFMPDNNLSEIMVNGKVSVFPVKRIGDIWQSVVQQVAACRG